ncbi:MAG: CRISPR-associated helicase Cas3' [Deltaproteobacteria bacterium]|nr:CRISPR-associated helicase Cas3' [Deltaproteobacteria bacterium]
MGAPERLLAKSVHHVFGELTLEQHLADTEQAAVALFARDNRVTRRFLSFFGLDFDKHHARFVRTLRCAGLVHDLGKANEDFFGTVTRTLREAQAVRHEHFSALVLSMPSVRVWLESGEGQGEGAGIDYDALCAAVLSHHLKVAAPGSKWRGWCHPSRDVPVALFLGHPEVTRTLARVHEIAGLSQEIPLLSDALWSMDDAGWQRVLRAGVESAKSFAHAMRRANREPAVRERRQFVLAVKAGLIAADSVASATFREGLSMDAWVEGTLHQSALTRDEIYQEILEPRVAEIQRKAGTEGQAFAWHNFQEGAARQGPRALMLAGCGSGKTLAAWRWIADQCAQREVGRVVFLYPTRGTATEGFRDYVGWAPETKAALVHGTAGYELNAMFENPSDATLDKSYASESSERLFSLGLWSKRYFSATVDQFLAFIEHGYGAMCLLPLLADSLVVLDEVHSYDKRLFENTLSFLKNFDVPVLAMTATLSTARRGKLAETGMSIYPTESDRADLEDLEAREAHPRYVVARCESEDAAMAQCLEALARGERVLWVVNTVARAQRITEALRPVFAQVVCYHSRFKLSDRQAAHQKTMALFKGAAGRSVAVTTQVCEMSLDLDADVLITEVCPLSSLVQRMGRANRSERRPKDFRARVYVYEPEHMAPYVKPDLEATRAALAGLVGPAREVSQRELAELLERFGALETSIADAGLFLSSGWYAVPGSLRDEDGFSQPCVLSEDLAAVKRALRDHEPIDGYVLPAPRQSVMAHERYVRGKLPSYLGVVSSDDYTASLGLVVTKDEVK